MSRENSEPDNQKDYQESEDLKENENEEMSSVRRKFKKGKRQSNSNEEEVSGHNLEVSENNPNLVQNEEKEVIIKKEIKTNNADDDNLPFEEDSNVYKKIVVEKEVTQKIKKIKKEVSDDDEPIQKEIKVEKEEKIKDSEKPDLEEKKDSQKEGKVSTTIKTIEITVSSNDNQNKDDIVNNDKNEIVSKKITTIKTSSEEQNQSVKEEKQIIPKEEKEEKDEKTIKDSKIEYTKITKNFTNDEDTSNKRNILKEEKTTDPFLNKYLRIQPKKENEVNQFKKEIVKTTKITTSTTDKPERDIKKDTTTSYQKYIRTKPIIQTNISNLPNMLNKDTQLSRIVVNRGRQTPNQTISKTTTTTTTVINRRNQDSLFSRPLIKEPLINKRQILSNQTSIGLVKNSIVNPISIRNDRKDYVTTVNTKNLVNQKSTPVLRGGVTKSIVEIRRSTLDSIPQDPELKNNISTVSILDKKNKPKKEYVLHVRKTDVILPKNRIRMEYTTNPNSRDPIVTDYNTKTTYIKNINREPHNYSTISNTSVHVINETGRIPKKEIKARPRRVFVIKTEKRPSNIPYNYSTINATSNKTFGQNKLYESQTILRGRNNNNNNPFVNKNNDLLKNRNKNEPINYRSKIETKISKISEIRNPRNKITPTYEANKKVNIIKTNETKLINNRGGRRANPVEIKKDSGNKKEDLININRNKIITIKTSEVISSETDKPIANEGKTKITKISITGTSGTEDQKNENESVRLRLEKNKESEKNDDNKETTGNEEVNFESKTVTSKEVTIEYSEEKTNDDKNEKPTSKRCRGLRFLKKKE